MWQVNYFENEPLLRPTLTSQNASRYFFRFYALFPPLKCQNCLYIFKNCLVAFFGIMIWCEKSSLDTRAIITRGLYTFCPIFHYALYCTAVYNTERLIFHDSFLPITFIRMPSMLQQKIDYALSCTYQIR